MSAEFEKIISFDSLYKAHRRARLGKRGKKEVVNFEINLSQNLWALHYDLKYGNYELGEYHKFMIYDPKEREIQAISYRDRIVQHSVCDNYLIPLLEKRLIYHNVACRKKKGTSLAIKSLKKFMAEHFAKMGQRGYFVKIDIKKFFSSIDHALLKEKIKTLGVPQDVYALLEKIIDSYSFSCGKGLPMGNQSSQCFALLYLDRVDRFIKEKLRIRHYIRYMDDMILISEKKSDAEKWLKEISREIEFEKLELNKKSQIIAFKIGINFLGRRFFVSSSGEIIQKLSFSTKKRIEKKIKGNIIKYGSTEFGRKKLELSFTSYQGLMGVSKSFLKKRFFHLKIQKNKI